MPTLHDDEPPINAWRCSSAASTTQPLGIAYDYDYEHKQKQCNHQQIRKKTRIASFDLARGLGVVMMIICHVLIEFGDGDYLFIQPYNNLQLHLLAISTAPVFHFLMGASIGASSDPPSMVQAVKRGLRLVGMGYTLSILYSVLPGLFFFHSMDYEDLLESFLKPDSLHTSGIAIIALAWLQSCSGYICILSIMVVLFASHWFWKDGLFWWEDEDVGTYYTVLEGILRISFEEHDVDISEAAEDTHSQMPLFPWLAYSLIGMMFGKMAGSANNVNEFHGIGAKYGTLMIIVGVIVAFINPGFISSGEYYRSGPVGIIWISGVILWWLWILDRCNSMVPEFLHRHLVVWSKNITHIFFVHWLIICLAAIILPKDLLYNQSQLGVFCTSLLTLILTDFTITFKSANWHNIAVAGVTKEKHL